MSINLVRRVTPLLFLTSLVVFTPGALAANPLPYKYDGHPAYSWPRRPEPEPQQRDPKKPEKNPPKEPRPWWREFHPDEWLVIRATCDPCGSRSSPRGFLRGAGRPESRACG